MDLGPKEKLQPSLLDRLTDDEPDRKQESRERRVISPARLREGVRRDLTWLFNTTNLAAAIDLESYSHVARSTLNYGIPDLAGRTLAGLDVPALEQLLKRAIWDFEPRLLRSTVKVRLMVDKQQLSHNAMTFVIEAELWAQPIPLRLFMRTDIDLETGVVEVSELGAQG